MTLQVTLARVEALQRELANPAALIGAGGGGTAAPAATGPSTFASALRQAGAGYGAGAATMTSGTAGAPGGVLPAYGAGSATAVPGYGAGAGGPGERIVAAAEGQVGQAEQPPGSNESPAIAEYRGATAGAVPGAPWCAYFASWAARQAGEPIGPNGQGLGSVSEIWSWAQSSGRAVANGAGVVPRPGDLIVFGDQHVGIVRGVLPDGRVQTIEGNYEDKVAANVRPAGEATGYVRMS